MSGTWLILSFKQGIYLNSSLPVLISFSLNCTAISYNASRQSILKERKTIPIDLKPFLELL